MKNFLTYLCLTLAGACMLLPFLWMLLASVKTPGEILVPSHLLPAKIQWANFAAAWHAAPFARYLLNSLLVTLATTLGQLGTGILAAFAFTHLRFWGRKTLFAFLLALMMVPGELLLITNFTTLAQLRWLDSYKALIIPWLASVFTLFILTQTFAAQPRSLYYAARMDGASDWQYLWHVLVPTTRTAIIAAGVLQALGAWNAFMWPLIVTNTDSLRTLPVGLTTFSSDAGPNFALLMAGTTMVLLPMMVLYLALQKYIVLGLTKLTAKETSHEI